MKKNLKHIIVALIFLSCAHSNVKVNKEKTIDIMNESTMISVATHIVTVEGIHGFIINDIDFCLDDVEYRFVSYNSDGHIMEEGYYFGIGRVPYLVELELDAHHVIIYKYHPKNFIQG